MATLKEKLEIFISSIDKTLKKNKPDLQTLEFERSFSISVILKVHFDIFRKKGDNKTTFDIIHNYWLKNKNVIKENDRMWLMICKYLAELDFELYNVYYSYKEKYNYSSFLETAREMYLLVL